MKNGVRETFSLTPLRLLYLFHQIVHVVQSCRFIQQVPGGSQRTAGEQPTGLGPVGEDDGLVLTAEVDLVLTHDVAAT